MACPSRTCKGPTPDEKPTASKTAQVKHNPRGKPVGIRAIVLDLLAGAAGQRRPFSPVERTAWLPSKAKAARARSSGQSLLDGREDVGPRDRSAGSLAPLPQPRPRRGLRSAHALGTALLALDMCHGQDVDALNIYIFLF